MNLLSEVRCHVCGARIDGGNGMIYAMGQSLTGYGETCSAECYEIYYENTDLEEGLNDV